MSTAQYWRGIVLVLSAATCWGLQSPIAKIISEAGISLMSAVVIRAALVVAILGFWGIWKKKAEILRPDRELVRGTEVVLIEHMKEHNAWRVVTKAEFDGLELPRH